MLSFAVDTSVITRQRQTTNLPGWKTQAESVDDDRRRMTGDMVGVKAEWTGRSPSTRTRRGIITRQTRLDIDTQLTLIRCPWQNDMTLQVCSVHVSVAIQVVDGEGDERQQEVVDDIGLEPG